MPVVNIIAEYMPFVNTFPAFYKTQEEFRSTTVKATKLVLLLLVPTVILILPLGDKILLLFGQEYSS